MEIKNYLKTYQQIIVLFIGYLLVAGLGFSLGRLTYNAQAAPEIKVEEAFAPLNNTLENATNQSSIVPNPTPSASNQDLNCSGQIKGNIGSGGSKVYHLPGGSFYNRTKPEACFANEAEAKAAGFRPSSN
jgi:hypothetical protein